jgi:hypothetical protein
MNVINCLNQSKFFAGFAMLLLNLGSKYITVELSETQEEFLQNTIIRRFILFIVFWIGTKDIMTSLILTSIFIIFVSHLFNENSRFCLIPVNKNKNKISKKDYANALKLVKSYEAQTKNLA